MVGFGDLVSIQMQNRKHRAVVCGIQEFIRMPTGGERAGFGFSVADHAARDQVRIVEDRAVAWSSE